MITTETIALPPLGETREWTAALLGQEVTVISGTGHMSPLEAPDAWSEVVGEFWRALSDDARTA